MEKIIWPPSLSQVSGCSLRRREWGGWIPALSAWEQGEDPAVGLLGEPRGPFALTSPGHRGPLRTWSRAVERLSFWSLLVYWHCWRVRPFNAGPRCGFSPCPGPRSLGKGDVGHDPGHCSLSMECIENHFCVFLKESTVSLYEVLKCFLFFPICLSELVFF